MYDQVTLGLNVDPFILSALKEDITNRTESSVDCRFLREFSHCLMQIQR